MKYQSGGGKEASNEVEKQLENNRVSNEVEVGGGEETSNDEVTVRKRRKSK